MAVRSIILHRYRFERDYWRVGGVLASFPLLVAVVGAMIAIALAADTPVKGLVFLMIAPTIGFLRNRPLFGIVMWELLAGWIFGIGLIVALVKACGNSR